MLLPVNHSESGNHLFLKLFYFLQKKPSHDIFDGQTSLLISSTMLESTALLSSTQLQGTGL
jgi:hypothetical protein